MTAPKYIDYLRRELEDNNGLSTEQRMELLKEIGKLEGKKLDNQRLRIKNKVGRHYGPPIQPKPLKDLPPATDAAPIENKPMGQSVDEAIARCIKETQDGKDREQHQPARPDGHPTEGGPGGPAGT
jgi:hypothetical protein